MKTPFFLLGILIAFLPGTVFAVTSNGLYLVNQRVCTRFEEDVAKMAAIMEEVRNRKGIKETRVAFGGVDTPIKSADYQITYVAEAIAFQRGQKYSSQSQLRYSLETLRSKILNAKTEVGKVLDNE